MHDDEILLEEWKEVRTTLRHFASKRFAQLTVFIAAAGFMFSELLPPATPHPPSWSWGLCSLSFFS